jgi:AcrR family transcriptional regulator
MIGSFNARVVPINVNFRYVADELRYVLENSRTKAIVYQSMFAATLARVLPGLPEVKLLLQSDAGTDTSLLPGAQWYERALAGAATRPPECAAGWSLPYILYPGGTTGMPKGVMWRHADIFAPPWVDGIPSVPALGGSRAAGGVHCHQSFAACGSRCLADHARRWPPDGVPRPEPRGRWRSRTSHGHRYRTVSYLILISVKHYSSVMATAAPLADAKRQAATLHILTAARHFVVANGLDVTMDQIANASGVSRTTLFRLFGSRDQLIADSFAAAFEDYGSELPAYDADGDVETWLRATCDATHRMNARFGPGYWELTSRPDLSPPLAAIERTRSRRSRVTMAEIAGHLWRAQGSSGAVPAALTATVAAHLSAYFTAAVVTDTGYKWNVASDLAFEAITCVLQRVSADLA